jgi:hypothetical protein
VPCPAVVGDRGAAVPAADLEIAEQRERHEAARLQVERGAQLVPRRGPVTLLLEGGGLEIPGVD